MRLSLLHERVAVDAEGRLYVCPDRPTSCVFDIWLAHSPPSSFPAWVEWEWRRPYFHGGGNARLSDHASPALYAVVASLLDERKAA